MTPLQAAARAGRAAAVKHLLDRGSDKNILTGDKNALRFAVEGGTRTASDSCWTTRGSPAARAADVSRMRVAMSETHTDIDPKDVSARSLT